tara:strand:+ start:24736 stop:25260 length:525 start_codon:yes stop_codon:yes gene_type:complete
LEGKMIEVGRICVKTAGRDAGLKCVIVDVLNDKFVLIDGETRRRKCNVFHLEPLKEVVKIKKNASHDDVKKEFEKLGLKVRETKPKPKKERQAKKRKTPEQLSVQKEEKKKLRDIFKLKSKDAVKDKVKEMENKSGSLEEKAGLVDKSKEIKADKKEPQEEKASKPAKKSDKKK